MVDSDEDELMDDASSSDSDSSIDTRVPFDKDEYSDEEMPLPSFKSINTPIIPAAPNLSLLSEYTKMQFGSTKTNPIQLKPTLQPKPVPEVTNKIPAKAFVQTEKAAKDFASFTKHSGGMGMKLMMKMGYTHGQGLGVEKNGMLIYIKHITCRYCQSSGCKVETASNGTWAQRIR